HGDRDGDVRAFARSLGGGGAPARRARLADGLAQRAPRGRLHRPRLVRPRGVQRVDVYGRADSYITRSAVNMQRAQAVACGLERFLARESTRWRAKWWMRRTRRGRPVLGRRRVTFGLCCAARPSPCKPTGWPTW